MTFKLNNLSKQPVAYSHHGSLSRQLRQNVEQNLKKGELKAIVATSSLEMGIDIGHLDEVVLIQSPPSVSSAVQRIGRAGHQVNAESRGSLYCAHVQDLIASAVLAKAIDDQDIEPITPIESPLDVLAQVLVSMTGLDIWDMDELYAVLKTSWPYHELSRVQYDLVLNMLAGRYADTRIRELKPRVSIDRLDNTVEGKKGALLALYTSGGTIPDRGYYKLRHHESNAAIGELDEEYVWEAKIGQIATVGTQNWKIMRITHNDVFAAPAGNSRMDAPFWIAEGMNRDVHFSNQILEFLEQAQACLTDHKKDKVFEKDLIKDHHLDSTASKELIRFLNHQKEVTGCALPHRHHILLEYVRSGPDGNSFGNMLVIHTLWGGQLNRPYAMALEAAWVKRFGEAPEIFPGNDAIVVQLPHQVAPQEILSLVPAGQVEDLLKAQLEKTGFFSARFRECAGRALLVIRNKINQRMPLWMTRLKSKKLLENVLQFEDFPILLETWRTCLKDEFDIEHLQVLLQEIETGDITWSTSHTSRPSPFAAAMAWNQINQYMYREDEGASDSSSLGSDLVRDLVFSPGLRPVISMNLVKEFEIKCQRLAPGYAPTTARDLTDWVKERIAIPFNEWQALLDRTRQDETGQDETRQDETGQDQAGQDQPGQDQAALETVRKADQFLAGILDGVKKKVVVFHIEYIDQPLVVSLELASKIKGAWYEKSAGVLIKDLNGGIVDIEESSPQQPIPDNGETDGDTDVLFFGQWLRFYGPKPIEFIEQTLGIDPIRVSRILDTLMDTRQMISGLLIKDGPDSGRPDPDVPDPDIPDPDGRGQNEPDKNEPVLNGIGRDQKDRHICDSENFEILLRLSRSRAVPQFEALDIEYLPLFLARYQGLVHRGNTIDDIFDRIEQLACLPIPAETWESEVLPARIYPYHPSFLDTILLEGDLLWLGFEKKKIAFTFASDLDFMGVNASIVNKENNAVANDQANDLNGDKDSYRNDDQGDDQNGDQNDKLDRVFKTTGARYDFSQLMGLTGYDSKQLSQKLWAKVWQSGLCNETFSALRKGIETRFKAPEKSTQNRRSRFGRRQRPGRNGFSKWKGALPFTGHWFKPQFFDETSDFLGKEELNKDRVRLLLDRYGILFRELIVKELPKFKWAAVFRSLRLMELSGEILSGHFFKDVPGVQFISHKAFRQLTATLPEDDVFFMNATDPASVCGMPLSALKQKFPRRLQSNHLVFKGKALKLVSQRNGKDITIHAQPDDASLIEYLAPLSHLLTRQFKPLKNITIETINGETASQSPYLDAFETVFNVLKEYRTIVLYRQPDSLF